MVYVRFAGKIQGNKMALYVYITERCRNEARQHNRLSEVEKFAEKIEKVQLLTPFYASNLPYLKKRFDRQVRLLAVLHPLEHRGEKHSVVVFLRIMIRGSKEYEQVNLNLEAYVSHNFQKRS